ncbi:DNA polymerase III, subunit gamma and tau [Fulvimarina manganoxydans]|uniref:DNA polymerase III subunit gamma/tau n=2 Tax=Fulvimarina manganoxydans TaxID=937218 RepID=A0A1W1YFL0_9HYPH|nr:DNA polymerase III subunit gamma/tau [Fulvimarina manganoxydans]SMC34611.1 DNA polymerase III, subunit gamma and tau [Fulvimarina manganoxydans]
MSDTATKTEEKAAYRVLARKYRPHSFKDLIGQEPMVRTLTNAFDTGRIAQAWMLTGVRGVGKTTTARILARALNYETDAIHQPTIHMEEPGIHCQAIMEGRHVDVVEMDAASHTGIDDIREIIAQVRYRPVSARYKVYIIDEVHMLSTQAFNGLLKTLEEPPEHVKFVFATTEIRKVPITVLSRCQRFDLRRVDSATLMAHLKGIAEKEAVGIDDDALRLIARAAEGSVRDSLSLTDQAIAHGAGHVDAKAVRDMLGLADRVRVVDLFEQVMKGDASAALKELRDQHASGADPAVVLADLADFTHLVTTLRYVPEAAQDAAIAPEEAERGLAFSQSLSIRTLGQVWQMLLKALDETRNADSPRQAAEMALIRIAHAADLPSPDDLLRLLKTKGSEALPEPSSSTPNSGAGGSATSATASSAKPEPAFAPKARAMPDNMNAPEAARSAASPSPVPAAKAETADTGTKADAIEDAPSATSGRAAAEKLAEVAARSQTEPERSDLGSAAAAPVPASTPADERPIAIAETKIETEAESEATSANNRPVAAAVSAPVARMRSKPLSLTIAGDPSPLSPGTQPQRQTGPAVEITSFLALVALAKDKRDSRLEAWLRRYIRPVKMEARRLEIGLVDEAPSPLVSELTKRLHDWTGERWVITLVSDAKTPTLEEERIAKRRALLSDAAKDPAVAAILEAFPGAKIADVRLKGEAEVSETAAEFVTGGDTLDAMEASAPLDESLSDDDIRFDERPFADLDDEPQDGDDDFDLEF